MAIKPEIRERVDGHDISTETVVNGCADGVIPAEEMDPPKRPENRPLCEGETGMRRIMSVMTAKNHEISVLIEKLNLEIR